MEGFISIRGFAKKMKCSDTAVHKAIKAGKIVNGVKKDGEGRPWINEEVAKNEWAVYFDHDATQNKELAKHIPSDERGAGAAAATPAAPETGTVASLAKARLAKEVANAKLKNLEFQKKSGALVEKDKVHASLFNAGKEVRAAMQAIPDRHIDEIFSAGSRNAAHKILADAIADTLEMLADLGNRELTPRAA